MPNGTPSSVAAFVDAAPTESISASAAPGIRLWETLRHDRTFKVATLVLVSFMLAALLAPVLAPYDPTRQFELTTRLQPPSAVHWFGTDPVTRDVFSRVLYGGRISLAIAFLAVALTLGIGTAFGAVAGYAGGLVDTVMMRTIDACLSVPRILLLIAVLSLWGDLSTRSLVLLIGVTGWFGVAHKWSRSAIATLSSPAVPLARLARERLLGTSSHTWRPRCWSPPRLASAT